jgi:hypothetical protein
MLGFRSINGARAQDCIRPTWILELRTGSDGSNEHLMPASLIEIRTTSNYLRDMQYNPLEHLY